MLTKREAKIALLAAISSAAVIKVYALADKKESLESIYKGYAKVIDVMDCEFTNCITAYKYFQKRILFNYGKY